MSIYLHPSAFVETTGDCSGPRYVRSQPSRESGGVLLNECDAKYLSKFELPTRNIRRYLAELQDQWDKINPKDREDITQNLVKNMPKLSQMIQKSAQAPQMSSPDVLTFIRDYVAQDPEKRTKEVLDGLYYEPENIKQAINKDTREKIYQGFRDWSDDQSLWYHLNLKTFIFLFVMCLLFVFVGIMIQQSTNKK